MTVLDLCTDAAQECGAIAIGETLEAAAVQQVLGKLRRLLNNWNADQRAVYAAAFDTYTLVPSLDPHTIGPTGTFVVTIRPVSLDGANLILPSSPTGVQTPIKVRDKQWWLAQTVPDISTTYPTDVYYQADWPNGKLYFWPIPTAAYQVQLMTRVLLNDLPDLTTTFTLPPGYQDAITLTLAEDCLTLFPAAAPGVAAQLERKGREARTRIFANNDPTPKLRTADSGLTGSSDRRGTWNFWTGQVM